MSSKDASSATEHKKLRVVLSNGRMAFEGVDGFSIDLKSPELKVGDLYNAVFSTVETPTSFTVSASPEVAKDSKASEYYKDLKELVESASKKINASLGCPLGGEGCDGEAVA